MSFPLPSSGDGQASPDDRTSVPAAQQDGADDESDSDDTWAPSSWDLRQGLDIAELDELPAEWPGTKPR